MDIHIDVHGYTHPNHKKLLKLMSTFMLLHCVVQRRLISRKFGHTFELIVYRNIGRTGIDGMNRRNRFAEFVGDVTSIAYDGTQRNNQLNSALHLGLVVHLLTCFLIKW